MRQLVVDSSAVLKWIAEPGSHAARALRTEQLVVPPLLFLEVVNVAGRSWRWSETALDELVGELEEAGLDVVEPPLRSIASWTARGLTACDACYVAVAEALGCALVTTDDAVLEVAPGIAQPLGR